MPGRPAPIRTDTSNAFAHRTIRERIPAILRETQRLNPDYAPAIHQALDRLHDSLVSDAPIPMLDLPTPDYDDWLAAWTAHQGETWQATEWFFAEIYGYRLLLQAVRWWETARDPFAPKKAEEYAGAQVWDLLDRALAVSGSSEEVLSALIEFALWGNRIDLSYALAASHGHQSADGDLLVDERAPVIDQLLRQRGPIHLILDNAGSELALDLALSDRLLTADLADQVVLHLKLHPTFVSDATVPDVLHFLDLARARQSTPAAFSDRLRGFLEARRLILAPDAYWNSTRFLWELPPRLKTVFSSGRLAIIKGDANYRRMVGDAVWPPETPLAQVTPWFPCPLLVLRSLKSDPIVGLPDGLADQLDRIDDQWRVNGRRGVLQTSLEEA